MNEITRRTIIGVASMMFAFSWAGSPSSAAQTTLERIVSEGKVTVGIVNDRTWGYVDESGNVTGFDPDLVRAALEPLGLKKIDFVVSEFPALISSLQSKRFDIIGAGMWITPTRCAAVGFSDPDVIEKDGLLVMKGNPLNIHSYADIAANPKLLIAADRGSAAIEHAKSAGVPDAQILQLTDYNAAIAALTGGRANGLPAAASSVAVTVKDPNLAGVVEIASPFTGYVAKNGVEAGGASALGFRLEDKDLREAYNKRLAEMKADGTFEKLKQKYGIATETATVTAEQLCSLK